MKVTELVTSFAQPIVEGFGCRLWDVEYVREGSERFLRLYIDKDGGVDIDDCEKIHRAVDPVLDEKDPIAESYHFEVCSAGIERPLKRTDVKAYAIPATRMAGENGIPTLGNMILVGKILAALGEYNEEGVNAALAKVISAKRADMLELNYKALELGAIY